MTEAIVNNRVCGTRITVWNILHYLKNGWTHEDISDSLGLSVEQVGQAAQYIEDHRDEVLAVHQQIEQRNARGNTPEVEARLARTREKIQNWKQEREDRELNRAGNSR